MAIYCQKEALIVKLPGNSKRKVGKKQEGEKVNHKKYKNKKNKKSPTENNDRRQWTKQKLLHFGRSLFQMLTSNSRRQNIKLQLKIFRSLTTPMNKTIFCIVPLSDLY